MEKDIEAGKAPAVADPSATSDSAGFSSSSPSASPFAADSLRSTPVTATLAITMVVFTLLQFIHPFPDRVLAFVPGGFMGYYYIWTIVTGALYHSAEGLTLALAMILLVVNSLTLIWAGSYLERIWGRTEYLRYLAIVANLSAGLTLLLAIFGYLLTGTYDSLILPVGGFTAGAAALLTALKQLRPEEEVLAGIRIKNLPLAYIFFTVAALAIFSSALNALYLIIGWQVSWVYLRWFQPHGEEPRGDSSTEMNFASFFPESFQPAVFRFSQILQRLCFFWMPKQKSTNVRTATGALISVLDAPQDVERRRAIALKALDEKFMSMKALPKPSSTPLSSSQSLASPNSTPVKPSS